jgi:hypothetical protein
MASDVRDGTLDLRFGIDVHDESGGLNHGLPFTQAAEILFVEESAGLERLRPCSSLQNERHLMPALTGSSLLSCR